MSSIIDVIYGAIALVGFGIAVMVGYVIYTSIGATGMYGSYAGSFEGFWTAINNVSIFIVVGLVAATVLSSFLISEHPAFFFVSIILLFVQALIIPSVVNSFNAVAAQSGMAASLAKFDLLILLIDNLPLITVITSAIAAVVGLMRSKT